MRANHKKRTKGSLKETFVDVEVTEQMSCFEEPYDDKVLKSVKCGALQVVFENGPSTFCSSFGSIISIATCYFSLEQSETEELDYFRQHHD